MDTRDQLQELLSEYVVDTLSYIQTVWDFCDEQPKWTLRRETELKNMRDIKDQADIISLKVKDVFHSKNKAEAFGQFMLSGIKKLNPVDSRLQKLEKKLGTVLKDTLEGLDKLDHFLDAVEKLTVTSLFVFSEQGFLPMGVSPKSVQAVITAARMASPLLIHFKRNAEKFFLPSLINLDVLTFQLDKYICTAQQICEKMGSQILGHRSKSVTCNGDTNKWKKAQSVEKFFNEDSMQKKLDHLNQLCQIRMDQNTRLKVIFQEHAQEFIHIFSQCRSRMEKSLSDLEEKAIQLDRMKKGASISTVAGSTVGIAGGVFSIVGLALAPVTAGISLALTLTGVGLGVTSGVNSLVTGFTEAGVNIHTEKKAQESFQRFMDDVKNILACLEQASSEERLKGLAEVDWIRIGMLMLPVRNLAKGIDTAVDIASAFKVLKTKEVVATATKAGLQEAQCARSIPNLAADLPDIGQLAKGTPLALSKSARAGFISLNAICIGFDVFFICKESISLAKENKSEASQLIHSRLALWKSELEAWQKIHDSLDIGEQEFAKRMEFLNQPFFLS